MILSLPFSLPDHGRPYALQTRDGFIHPADDRRAMLLRAAKLHVVSGVPQADIMAAFHAPPWHCAVKRYRERGEDAFFEPTGDEGVPSSTPGGGRRSRQTARFRDHGSVRSATRHPGEHL